MNLTPRAVISARSLSGETMSLRPIYARIGSHIIRVIVNLVCCVGCGIAVSAAALYVVRTGLLVPRIDNYYLGTGFVLVILSLLGCWSRNRMLMASVVSLSVLGSWISVMPLGFLLSFVAGPFGIPMAHVIPPATSLLVGVMAITAIELDVQPHPPVWKA